MMSSAGKVLRVFVGNIPWTVSRAELWKHFEKFGTVRRAFVAFDETTKISKGYGFVTFANTEGVTAALSQDVHMLEGAKLEVRTANPPKS